MAYFSSAWRSISRNQPKIGFWLLVIIIIVEQDALLKNELCGFFNSFFWIAPFPERSFDLAPDACTDAFP
ncbi:MAG: hypothetical protein RMJ84_01110 [Sandaracinaceae bacterium]|nr:hypothetical protein [Sandaracinaceae bacterium]